LVDREAVIFCGGRVTAFIILMFFVVDNW